jgi:hypothetical protein
MANVALLWTSARWHGRTIRRLVELIGTAIIAVAGPVLTAAVDGVCDVMFALTIWELWSPAKAVADVLAGKMMVLGGHLAAWI